MELNPLVIIIAAVLTQALTWALARWGLGADSKLRSAIPALAAALAVGVVAAVQAVQGADAFTWQTLGEGLLAGAAAVFMHSQGREVAKALGSRDKQGPGTMGKAGLVLLVLLIALPLTSCSGPARNTLTSTLKAGEAVAYSARAQALQQESTLGCYAATLSAATLATAGAGVAAWSTSGAPSEIPGVRVDYTPCAGPAALAPLMAARSGEVLRGYLASLTAVTQVLYGYLAGELECEERVLTLALVAYIDQAVGAVVEELVAPDGVVEVAAVVVDVGACGG